MGFGEWLRSEIERRDLSISEFARRIGVSHGTVSRWLSATRRPDADSAGRIARALGVPPVVVLDMLGQRQSPTTQTEHLEQRLGRLHAERAGLQDETRQRELRRQQLEREIHELEIAQMRLSESPMKDRDRDAGAALAAGMSPQWRESPAVERLESRIDSTSQRMKYSPLSEEPSAQHAARRAYMELTGLLDVLTERLNVGREINDFLHRVSHNWSFAEQEAFAIGMQLGLVAGRATLRPPTGDALERSSDDPSSAKIETPNS